MQSTLGVWPIELKPYDAGFLGPILWAKRSWKQYGRQFVEAE
jgi:hypothetical protein